MSDSATQRIIPFPETRTDVWPDVLLPETISQSFISKLVSSIVASAGFVDAVKSLVEGYAVKSIVRSLELRMVRSDPFDPIYLADLEPDPVSRTDARQLWKGAGKVKDLSAGVDLFENEE